MQMNADTPSHKLMYFTTFALLIISCMCLKGNSQFLDVREVCGLTAGDMLMLVVMEHCNLGSLASAIAKHRFQPHGKWAFHTTYVSAESDIRH